MRIIDLFSGCGGLSLGFMKDGHTVLRALEYDAEIAKTYKLNHPEVDVIVDDIKKYYEAFEIASRSDSLGKRIIKLVF